MKNRNGNFYLRDQRNNSDRRISLHTKDPEKAKLAAHYFAVTLAEMKISNIDLNAIKSWTLETNDQGFKLSTDNTPEDRESAIIALETLTKNQALAAQHSNQTQIESPPLKKLVTKTLGEAVIEYKLFISTTKTVEKSQAMALSAVTGLVKVLGGNFNCAEICDDIIEDEWMERRKREVAETTVKRDLSFIRSFVAFLADRKRKYCPVPLTLSMTAKGEHYEYLEASDLNKIFSNLTLNADVEKPWQFWLVVLGLYTGARIGELASLKPEYFSEKNGIKVMHLAGTKTLASERDLPIHKDLIELGLIEFVTTRRDKKTLFDLRMSDQNGAGAQCSRWFSEYKQKLGLKEMQKFHSFRHTLVDHLIQVGAGFEPRCQYIGHDSGGGTHSKTYGRNGVNLKLLQSDVVDRINWEKYCGWSPDLPALKEHADKILAEAKRSAKS